MKLLASPASVSHVLASGRITPVRNCAFGLKGIFVSSTVTSSLSRTLAVVSTSAQRNLILFSVLAIISLIHPIAHCQQALESILQLENERIIEGVKVQKNIDALSDKIKALESQYRQELKVLDGLKVYNDLLSKQVDNQRMEIAQLSDSISRVALIERQIVPLMVQMIEALDNFIHLDLPFLMSERTNRISRLRSTIERSDVTVAEKFRQIIEAYEIEDEYGRTIEAYKGTLKLPDSTREVNFLRIGRVSLIYQTDGGDSTGVWDRSQQQWSTLPAGSYRKEAEKGIRIAKKQVAPDLIILPVESIPENLR